MDLLIIESKSISESFSLIKDKIIKENKNSQKN